MKKFLFIQLIIVFFFFLILGMNNRVVAQCSSCSGLCQWGGAQTCCISGGQCNPAYTCPAEGLIGTCSNNYPDCQTAGGGIYPGCNCGSSCGNSGYTSCTTITNCCGNGSCESGETCGSCQTDCGTCPVATPTPTNPPGVTPTPTIIGPTPTIPGPTIVFSVKPEIPFIIYNDLNSDGTWDYQSGGEKRITPTSCTSGFTKSTVAGFSIDVQNNSPGQGWNCDIGTSEASGGCDPDARDTCNGNLCGAQFYDDATGKGADSYSYSCLSQKSCNGGGCNYNPDGSERSCRGNDTAYGALCNTNQDYCGNGATQNGNLRVGPWFSANHAQGYGLVTFTLPSGYVLTNTTAAKIGSATGFTCIGQTCTGQVDFQPNGGQGGGFACMGSLIKFGVAFIPPTPTSTPIPPTPTTTTAPGPWIKLKDTSFQSRNSLPDNNIPNFPATYDADDTLDPYFIIGNAGLLAMEPLINITKVNPNAKFSDPNPPYSANYSATFTPNYFLSPNSYLSYVKARKQYTVITSLSDISGSGIYVYNGSLSIDSNSAPFNQPYNIVLIATGTVTVTRIVPNLTFTPGGSVAVVAPNIDFSNNLTEAHGIFIANNIDTGSTIGQDRGLKIIGNLIAQSSPTALTNNRRWSNQNRPSLFIKFDPVQYINLFPYLSTASYQWNQIQ